MRPGGPVEEEQASAVIDLVLQGPGLEGIGRDLAPLPRAWLLTSYDESRRPLDVTGEVGHRHAAFASLFVARS